MACEQPVLMNWSTLEARPVARAFTPRQHCRACRLALLPLPLLPEMKFTWGLQTMIMYVQRTMMMMMMMTMMMTSDNDNGKVDHWKQHSYCHHSNMNAADENDKLELSIQW